MRKTLLAKKKNLSLLPSKLAQKRKIGVVPSKRVQVQRKEAWATGKLRL